MRSLIVLVALGCFALALVVGGGALLTDVGAKADRAAAQRVEARADLERARGEAQATITRASAEAYSDRALAAMPVWIMAFSLAIIGVAAGLYVLVRGRSVAPDAQSIAQAAALPTSVTYNIILPVGLTRRDQLDAMLQLAHPEVYTMDVSTERSGALLSAYPERRA